MGLTLIYIFGALYNYCYFAYFVKEIIIFLDHRVLRFF